MENERISNETLDTVFTLGVSTGALMVRCSSCKSTLTPEQHNNGGCPHCGTFVATGDPQPMYFVPN